jgi:hypothetical protein
MITAPTGLGEGTSNQHADAYRTLRNADAGEISAELRRKIDAPLMAAQFAGKPVLAYFELDTAEQQSPSAFLDDAVKAKSAGFQMDAQQMSEKTGYTLTLSGPVLAPAAAPGFAGQEPGKETATASLPGPAAEVAKAALNGAQVQALVEIMKSAATGQIPDSAVMPLMRASFPAVEDAVLTKLAGSLKGFVPTVPLLNRGAGAAASADICTQLATQLGVPAEWLQPVADLLAEIESKAADKAVSDTDLLAFAESAAARLPELFGEMHIDALADVFEKAMGTAAIEGARTGLRKSAAAKEEGV